MSIVEEWAIRLAQDVAPDEIDTAPMMAEAFAQGGKARKQLFARAGSPVGGFSPEAVTMVIPFVLQVISDHSGSILELLPLAPHAIAASVFASAQTAYYGFSAFKVFREVGQARAHESHDPVEAHAEPPEATSETTPKAQVKDTAPEAPPAPGTPDDEMLTRLRAIGDSMVMQLQRSGMQREDSERTTYYVLAALLKEPQSAAQFVEDLARRA